MISCMRRALEDAGVRPSDIDHINAHGTSTHLNDLCETRAIKAVFGDHASKIAIASTKSQTGHLLGAAGSVEAVFSVLALHTGYVPDKSTTRRRIECDLNYHMTNGPQKLDPQYVSELLRIRRDQRQRPVQEVYGIALSLNNPCTGMDILESPMDHILLEDPDFGAFLLESDRQMSKLELIASENFVSAAVQEAQGSVFTHKYAEGYPGKRYYGGCRFVDIAENLAIERAKKLFGCEYANVQPHSDAQANMATYFALAKPGDTILGMNLSWRTSDARQPRQLFPDGCSMSSPTA